MKISLESLKSEIKKQLDEITEEDLKSCYQCGKCSAGCPLAEFMDMPPHQVIRLAQLGLLEKVVSGNTIWMCAACVACKVRCPRGVDLSKIMEGLRQIILRDTNIDRTDINKIDKKKLKKLPQIACVGNFKKKTI
ncbi:4Fe-4S dicluster domain-containing protein [Elusimicrobiota bacterium]